MAPIIPVNLTIPPIAAPVTPFAGRTAGAAFQSAFAEAVSKVESFRQNTPANLNSLLSCDGVESRQVSLKAGEAGLSFDLFLQMRNKIVEAYEEIMRMQV